MDENEILDLWGRASTRSTSSEMMDDYAVHEDGGVVIDLAVTPRVTPCVTPRVKITTSGVKITPERGYSAATARQAHVL